MERSPEYVWLFNENCFAELLTFHAHYSLVRYTQGGNDYEVEVANDDMELIEWNDDDEK